MTEETLYRIAMLQKAKGDFYLSDAGMVCYLAEVEETCIECGTTLCVCTECAEDMGENFCPKCDKDTA